jgi:hypothetical protein
LIGWLKKRTVKPHLPNPAMRNKKPTSSVVTHEFGNDEGWQCSCGNEPHWYGFYPCNADGKVVEPTEADWKDGMYKCDRCGFVFKPEDVKEPTVVNLSTLSRRQKYELAKKIISEIASEWTRATEIGAQSHSVDATMKWQEDNVESYESNMSFDELAAEVRAVSFNI